MAKKATKKADSPEISECLKNLRYTYRKNRELFKKMREDIESAFGKQWDEKDEQELRKAGVEPLTINKIRPIIKILTGIERQSKSDIVAFPEGQEDSIRAEIATKLIKSVMKRSSGQNKLSAQFKSGIISGACFLEPFIDYSFDLINGDLRFKKVSANRVLYDPDAEEYDLSDAKYVIKISRKLTKEDLIALFPKKKKEIEKIEFNRFTFDTDGNLTKLQLEGYKEEEFDGQEDVEDLTKGYDLAEYYYKGKGKKYYVASQNDGTLLEVDSEEDANTYSATIEGSVVIEKDEPEIRRKAFVGNTELDDDVAWSYPRWKGYPLIPYMSEWNAEDGIDRELLIQGVVRSLKSLQFEYNKRRTQELRHLNSSIFSAFLAPKGAIDKPTMAALKKYGSTPGFAGEYDPEKSGGTVPESWRLRPPPLSQGHAQLAQENAQDIKEASGVNPDLLANDSTDQSGKAILLKQRQGLVMVQEQIDNHGETKKITGRFILSQLGELFTVETAARVVGEGWIAKQDAFKKPVFDPQTNQPQLGQDGKLLLETDNDLVGKTINEVLNDAGLGKYDVTIGEGVYTETTRLANHMMLMDMATQGLPIPPDVLVMESNLPENTKSRIVAAIEAQRQALEAKPVQQEKVA